MAQFDLKKATITFLDGNSHTLAIKVADGTLNYSEKQDMKYTKDRGLLSGVMKGEEQPVEVTIDLIWEHLKTGSGETVSPEDFLKQRGGASAYTSTDSDPCNPYSIDIQIVDARACGGVQTETITLPTFRWEDGDHDLKAGILKFKGKCNVTQATVVRS